MSLQRIQTKVMRIVSQTFVQSFVLMAFALVSGSIAQAIEDSPQSVVFEGRAYTSNDQPLLDTSVDFNHAFSTKKLRPL